jgi:D-Tyr-tRNAtyr deacylase
MRTVVQRVTQASVTHDDTPAQARKLAAKLWGLRALGARVETGRFGADMKVALVNDGPVTIIVEL